MMTAAELVEQLRLLPSETPVLVEGYGTGLDTIAQLRISVVTKNQKAQDWDGEYREVHGKAHGGTSAVVLLGSRGHRRRRKVGSVDAPPLGPRANFSSADISEPSVLLDTTTFAERRRCATESLPQACETDRIFCVTIDSVPMYPAFYVDPRFDKRQLESITKLLSGLASGSKWQFFTSPKGSLGAVSPLQALLSGRYDDVRASALAFTER